MSEVINLNKKRKAKARVEKEKQTSANRIKFGRTKEEKKLEKFVAEKAVRHIEGHRQEAEEE